MKRYIRPQETNDDIEAMYFCAVSARESIIASICHSKSLITASISSRDITRSMVRVKSSNVWSYAMNIRNHGDDVGDLYIQYKGDHGGKGDIYVYYDVPIKIFKKFVTAPSKGHWVWEYLRKNRVPYSKLTGDKRGKLPYAINH